MGKDYEYIDMANVSIIEDLDEFEPGVNMVLVRPELDTSIIDGNIKLYVDTYFEEIEYAPRIVRVIKTPSLLSIKGMNHYNDSFPTALDWSTEMELMPNDLAWVDPLSVINNNNTLDTNIYLHDNQIYFVIRYDKFIVAKRNDESILLNGYVLIEKIHKESTGDFLLPTKISDYSRVTHIGKPNKFYFNNYYSDKIDVNVGDVILNPKYLIPLEGNLHRLFDNGRVFFIVQRRDIPINFQDYESKYIDAPTR